MLRIVIVGPGRVGTALAIRFARAGADVIGFVGRSRERLAAALAATARGARALTFAETSSAHVVVFAVGDGDLQSAVAQCASAVDPRACSLWLHTSGRFGLDVFAAAGPRVRRAALHPVVPIPDAATGERALAGAPAVVEHDERARRLLQRLCAMLGVLPVPWTGGDRTLHHAACSLAANGLTALRAAVDAAFAASNGVAPEHRRVLADALMAAALRSSSDLGPVAALSGPVRRGDSATVHAHVASLAASANAAAVVYRALMTHAVSLTGGLSDAARRALLTELRPPEDGR